MNDMVDHDSRQHVLQACRDHDVKFIRLWFTDILGMLKSVAITAEELEHALIDGVNDRPSDAAELARLTRRFRLPAHVNLIPLNPTPGYPTVGTPRARVNDFHGQLIDLGVNATVRRNRGTDIDAACGQLRRSNLNVSVPSTAVVALDGLKT